MTMLISYGRRGWRKHSHFSATDGLSFKDERSLKVTALLRAVEAAMDPDFDDYFNNYLRLMECI